ncbi:hypothetical protein AnigIFM63604_002471 [Aspergillus niger]|uniref:Uncharacterized protein n=1 Tax=Aspergillus niger TaxID=5061 RepID=A0A9W5ZTZ6_ASPNG|nr:hypothetical protein AnigIFM63604_002471 [Aspergillus niger]
MDMTGFTPSTTVSLVRMVNLDAHKLSFTNMKGHRRYAIQFRRSATKQSIVPDYEEGVLDCSLWPESDNLFGPCRNTGMANRLIYRFDIPVPECLPPTVKTHLGAVSYALKAKITLPSGQTASTCKPLIILYRLIPSTIVPNKYFRRFKGSSLRIQTTIAQQRPNDVTCKAMFSVELVARALLSPGAREGEMKHIAIAAIKWWVDEVTVCIDTTRPEIQAFANPNHTSSRSLTQGKLGFRCPKAVFQSSDQGHQRDECFKVNFDIKIKESAKAADDLCERCYAGHDGPSSCSLASSPGIAVHHKLNIEVFTREGIFHSMTNKLSNQNFVARLYGSTYPLRIHKLSDEVVEMDTIHSNEEPPAFHVAQQMLPPSYET